MKDVKQEIAKREGKTLKSVGAEDRKGKLRRKGQVNYADWEKAEKNKKNKRGQNILIYKEKKRIFSLYQIK